MPTYRHQLTAKGRQFQFCCATLWQALWDGPKHSTSLGTELLPSKQGHSRPREGKKATHGEDKASLARA